MNEDGGSKRQAPGIAIALLAFVAVMITASLAMPRDLWGMAAAADVSPRVLVLIVFVAGFVSMSSNRVEAWLTRLGRGTAPAIALALIFMLGSWIGRIRLHWLGDQSIWLRSFESPDTYHVLEPVSFALARASANAVPEGAMLFSVLMAGLFVLLTRLLSGELERVSSARRAWLWLMLLFTPQLLFFRGYVESYPMLLLCLMTLAWALLRVLAGASMQGVWPAALGGVAAHVMGIAALPAVVYAGWRRQRWIALSGAALLVILVAVWVLSHHSRLPAHVGSLRMAFTVFDLRRQGWDGFLTPRHVLGIVNVLLLLGGPLLFTAPFLPWRTASRVPALRLFILFMVPGVLGLVFVRLLLGTVRDWDLFASFLYFMIPALATLWLARRAETRLPRHSSALLGLAFAHSMFWGSVDMDAYRGLKRAARLYGEDSTFAPEPRGRAAEDLAVIERERGNPAGAERWYELATRAMPKHWRYHHNLGSMAQSLGHVEKAKEAFTSAVALRPPVRAPYASLGSMYLRENNVAEALRVYDQGLHAAGPDFGLFYGRGVCQAELGDFAAAARSLDSSLVVNPGNADALLYRGIVSLRMGEPQRAIEAIQASLRSGPRPEGWAHLVEAAMAAGDSTLARAARRQSMDAISVRP